VAEAKLTLLKQEVTKGGDAYDSVIAKLVDGLVGLVLAAVATPILGGIALTLSGKREPISISKEKWTG